MKEFLESNGYRMWKHEEGTMHFQKRVDGLYPMAPVCKCNDKLFINVQVFTYTINGVVRSSYEMNMVHENQNNEWCDIKIYSLTEGKIIANLQKYEKQLLEMWNVFYCGGE